MSFELPEEWTLYGDITALSNVESGESSNENTSTLQQILKYPSNDILNGSSTSDEVIAKIPEYHPKENEVSEISSGVVSPPQGFSPAGTPPTSPPQDNLRDSSNELSELLSDVTDNFGPEDWTGPSDITASNSPSSDLYDMLDIALYDFEQIPDAGTTIGISPEDMKLLNDCLELNDRCKELEEPPSPKSDRYHPYKDSEKIVEKKLRKKQQNKDAASRYRRKKKAEKQEQGGELDVLLEKNKNLMSECKEKLREIDYLKELLRDVCKAKGLEPPVLVLK